jgi:hypothetical protein
MKGRKTNWIGHILRKNCLLNHVIDGKIEERIEETERRGGRRKQLLVDLKETRGYWKLKEEALARILWRIGFGRGCGPVVRQSDYDDDMGIASFKCRQVVKVITTCFHQLRIF